MIGWLITRVVPWRFDARAAGGLRAMVELRVRARGRVIGVVIEIADGRCNARRGSVAAPDATASVGLADLIRLVLGDAAWPQLLSRGRFEMSGDPFIALRLPAVFGFSAGAREGAGAGARERLSAGARERLSPRAPQH